MHFLDVRTDFAFKKVFGSEHSKNVLIDFLNAIIDFGGLRITDLTIVDPYQIPRIQGMKDTYVDVKAVLSNNQIVIIEMQVLNVQGFEQRILYNAAKAYSSQLLQADLYTSLRPVIALTITDFIMFRGFSHIISYWRLQEKETLTSYSDDIQLIFVELPKFMKTEEQLQTMTDKWLYFIKNAYKLDNVPRVMNEETLLEAFSIANTSQLSIEELEMQEKRRDFIMLQRGAFEKAKKEGREEGRAEGRAEGRVDGREEGRVEGKQEQIISHVTEMLRINLSLEIIAQVTKLTIEEIKSIALKAGFDKV